MMNPELTAREIQIIECGAQGMDIEETAAHTGLAPGTIRTHRSRITKKIGSKNAGFVYVVTVAYKRGILMPDPVPTPFRITPRQMRILLLVATGLGNEEIAGRIGVSGDTVKTHMRRLYEKTKTANRAHLVGESFRNGTLVLYRRGGK